MSKIWEGFGGGSLADAAREILSKSEKSARKYLKRRWLAAAPATLREARREAGLTQEEVAQRLGTKQPAIARLENDREGRFSLARYVEYALACDMMPLDIELEPVSEVRKYALSDPDAPRTATAYRSWADMIASGNIAQPADEETSVTTFLARTLQESLWDECNLVKPDTLLLGQELQTRLRNYLAHGYHDQTSWARVYSYLLATTFDVGMRSEPQRRPSTVQAADEERKFAA